MNSATVKSGIGILLLMVSLAGAREPKEYDGNVIYDEAKIPHYDLPPLLVTAEGKPVTTAEQWRTVRRPQIMSLFSNLIYGRVPEPERASISLRVQAPAGLDALIAERVMRLPDRYRMVYLNVTAGTVTVTRVGTAGTNTAGTHGNRTVVGRSTAGHGHRIVNVR